MFLRAPLARLASAAAALLWLSAPLAEVADRDWPRSFESGDGAELLVYQPQVEDWNDYSELTARAAFELRRAAKLEPVLGAMKLSASTDVDLEQRMVSVSSIEISDSSFPSLQKERHAIYDAKLRELFPTDAVTIELDRLLANLDREQARIRSVEAGVKPPLLFVSERDALLVLTDGEPMLEPIGDSDLMVVINTPSDLFWHKRLGTYYLRVGRSWLTSFKPDDGWLPIVRLPQEFNTLPDTPGWADARAALPGTSLAKEEAPAVFFSSEPAALLVFDGRPQLSQIPGTELLYVTNTESDVFLDSGNSGDFFVLLAGRWFRMPTLGSPLEYVGDQLPADFAKIPADHPAGRVLVSVPGTQQALEAALAAQIPTKRKVSRSEATVEVSYDGDPLFEPIPDTEVEYAVNTSFDVFRIAKRYYVCHEGVWFDSEDPRGPWKLIDEVPSPIYTITPASPKYHVTHTYIYGSTVDHVETGYDSGYLGAFVVGGLLVYGISNADYVHIRACSGHCRPYYRHHHRVYRTQPARHWHRHHHRHRHAYRHQIYGHGRHYDHLSGRFNRTSEVRRHQSVGETYAGVGGRGPAAPTAAVARADRQANIAGKTILREPSTRRDIYSGPDGKLYKRTDGRWSRYDNGGWQPEDGVAARPQPKATAVQTPSTPRATPKQTSSPPAKLGNAVRSRVDGAKRLTQFGQYRDSRAPAGRRGAGRAGPRR